MVLTFENVYHQGDHVRNVPARDLFDSGKRFMHGLPHGQI
jgi:hypothetical protein